MPKIETFPPIADEVPWSDHVTNYDRAHFIVYLRLLDASRDGVPDEEMVREILGLDVHVDEKRAARSLASHIRRAQWMAERGYRDLLDS